MSGKLSEPQLAKWVIAFAAEFGNSACTTIKNHGLGMKEFAKLNFYNVTKCGYFQKGGKAHKFGDLADTMADLLSWAKGSSKPLKETRTYEIEPDSDFFNTYCLDIQRHTSGDFALITWNETPAANGKVASVDGSEPVGVASVEQASLPHQGSIPGYPTYFWIMPNEGLLATIQFDQLYNGHQNLVRYMQGFLTTYSKYAHCADSDEVKLLGYSQNPAKPEDLTPRFESFLHYNPSEIEELRNNHGKIAKVVRHQVVKSDNS